MADKQLNLQRAIEIVKAHAEGGTSKNLSGELEEVYGALNKLGDDAGE